MGVALLQLFLCLAAGFLLWRLWRVFDREDAFSRGVVLVGFVTRAITGTILFWISWLKLPFARSLQLGDGLWFFGSDAVLYVPNATEAAKGGFGAIIHYTRTAASVTYVQSLATFVLLFGVVASVALLLNLFCYLGSCVAIIKLRNLSPAGRVPGAIALAAISLSPSAMLWSLQPLKDTLFQFLLVAFVAACVMWQRGWRSRPSPLLIVGAAAIMFATLFAMGGIRWYFALAALASALAFFILVAISAPRMKAVALIAGLLLFAALTQAFVRGAGPYTPPRLASVFSLSPSEDRRLDSLSPAAFAGDMEKARNSFDQAGGATRIGVGGALARLDNAEAKAKAKAAATTPAAPPPAAGTPPPAAGTPPPVSTGTVQHAGGAEPAAPPPAVHADAHPAPPQTQPATATVAAAAPPPAPSPAAAVPHAAPPQHTPAPAHAATPPQPAPKPATTVTAAPAPVVPVQTTTQTETASKTASKPVNPPAPAPAPAVPAAATPVPAPVAVSQPAPEPVVPASPPAIVLPESKLARLTAGLIAVFIPRTIAGRLGLIEVRGGKGFFWFSDLDTLVFDVITLFAIVYVLRRFRWATLRNPAFWFVALLAVMVGGPLAYSITNFGTLFRLRMMVYTATALIPLALAMAAVREREAAPEVESVERVAADDEPLAEISS